MPTIPNTPLNPLEIARETLRLLASRQVPPTPDNYRVIYNEISGAPDLPPPFPEKHLHALIAGFPKESPDQIRLIKDLERSIKYEDWDSFKNQVLVFLQGLVDSQRLAWGELISGLLQQWELRQVNLTQARKRDSLDHVLTSTASNPDLLFARLQGLVKVWSQAALSENTGATSPLLDLAWQEENASAEPALPKSADAEIRNLSGMMAALREMVVVTLEAIIALLTTDNPALAEEGRRLVEQVKLADNPALLQDAFVKLKRLSLRLNVFQGDQLEYRNSLISLLRLLIDNISELVVDDHWLHGQIDAIRNIIDKPLSQRNIDDAERCLREVIAKQSKIKNSLVEAKDALKVMLTTFVDQLSNLADSTSDYHDKIEVCAEKITQAEDIGQLQEVIADLVQETKAIQENTKRSQAELEATRHKVQETESRITQLQQELEEASSLVRHDQLTGVFNRRGLDEILVKECARARRHQTPLSLALLDIDNFKKLNDSFGHDTGDAALIHLSRVARESLRPQDSVGRYGGEEFIILLPETALEDAVAVVTRLQRELTRHIFMHEREKTLITFSAGVTLWQNEEAPNLTIKRADEAMYSAKKSGKNRVVAA
jgi:diguanylate cyclase